MKIKKKLKKKKFYLRIWIPKWMLIRMILIKDLLLMKIKDILVIIQILIKTLEN